MKLRLILLCLLLTGAVASAQRITDSSYRTVAHIKSDGTVQDASYRTIGHADGIPMKWAAWLFFFNNM